MNGLIKSIIIFVVFWLLIVLALALALAYIADSASADGPVGGYAVHQVWRYCGDSAYTDDGRVETAAVGTFYTAGDCIDAAAVVDLGTGLARRDVVLPMAVWRGDFTDWTRWHCAGGSCFGMPPRFLSVGVMGDDGVPVFVSMFDTWTATGWVGTATAERVLPIRYDWAAAVREYVKHHRGERFRLIVAEHPAWGRNAQPWRVRFTVEGVASGGQ